MLLTGTYNRSVDDKLRVAIPKRLRDVLESGSKHGIYIAPGTDKSLAIYTEETFARLADRLDQGSPTRHEVRTHSRLFFSRAQGLELDSQGRLRIPSDLAELAELGKDVVLVGVGDRIEIWAAQRWQSFVAENQGQYDQIAEAAFANPEEKKPN